MLTIRTPNGKLYIRNKYDSNNRVIEELLAEDDLSRAFAAWREFGRLVDYQGSRGGDEYLVHLADGTYRFRDLPGQGHFRARSRDHQNLAYPARRAMANTVVRRVQCPGL